MIAATICLPGVAAAQLPSDERAALSDLGPSYAVRYELRRGWYRGSPILYFDIGPQAAVTAPVFLVVTGFSPDGAPQLVPGQQPVFTTIPGLDGYTGILQVHYLVVGTGYLANSVRDGREAIGRVLRGEARLVVSPAVVNLPIVADGSTLAGDPDARPLRRGWYRGHEVPYFDFGRTEFEAAPIYPFVTGFDADGPRFLRAQANVVDVVPGERPGHDLWDVMFTEVGPDYQPDTIRDLNTLLEAERAGRLRIRRANDIRNCPVVLVNGVRAPR